MCVGDVEHLRHLFFECNFAVECWQLMGLNFDMQEVEYVSEWLLTILASKSTDVLVKVATILWVI